MGISSSSISNTDSSNKNIRNKMPILFDIDNEISSVYMISKDNGHTYKLMYGTKMGDASQVTTKLRDTSNEYSGHYSCQISQGYYPENLSSSSKKTKNTQFNMMNMITSTPNKIKEETHKATSFFYHIVSGVSALLIFLILGKIAAYLAYTKFIADIHQNENRGENTTKSIFEQGDNNEKDEMEKERLLKESHYGAFTI